ncbi:Carboxylesterase family-domain-containing protein [Mycena metata]|uniref:Carboxylesterase family-domain-containing protein n=1 Tax=Mycena metata TaxID=1033252 RepID=A0AAD7HGT6_9AGAR|nr:Carboxylesterase family-domain-containing protein [Mycena metata]
MGLTNSSISINTTAFSPAYPQIPLSTQLTPDVFSVKGGNRTEFFPVEEFSEDCLTLNIWTPVSTDGTTLPVLAWFFGGAFLQGAAHSLYFNPTSWIQHAQGHIVISANYRVNIFGFPNAPGLADRNLGLLDQRATHKWVHTNIGAFGGDPGRIVAWGGSSGAICVDFLHFLLPTDPIVYSSIRESGTVLVPAKISLSNNTAHELPAEDYYICIKSSVDSNKLAVQTFNPRDRGVREFKRLAIPGLS